MRTAAIIMSRRNRAGNEEGLVQHPELDAEPRAHGNALTARVDRLIERVVAFAWHKWTGASISDDGGSAGNGRQVRRARVREVRRVGVRLAAVSVLALLCTYFVAPYLVAALAGPTDVFARANIVRIDAERLTLKRYRDAQDAAGDWQLNSACAYVTLEMMQSGVAPVAATRSMEDGAGAAKTVLISSVIIGLHAVLRRERAAGRSIAFLAPKMLNHSMDVNPCIAVFQTDDGTQYSMINPIVLEHRDDDGGALHTQRSRGTVLNPIYDAHVDAGTERVLPYEAQVRFRDPGNQYRSNVLAVTGKDVHLVVDGIELLTRDRYREDATSGEAL